MENDKDVNLEKTELEEDELINEEELILTLNSYANSIKSKINEATKLLNNYQSSNKINLTLYSKIKLEDILCLIDNWQNELEIYYTAIKICGGTLNEIN